MDSVYVRSGRMFPQLISALILFQMRRVGIVALVVPLGAGALIAGVGICWNFVAGPAQAAFAMLAITQLYPAVVGMCALAVFAGDPLVELQESTPVGFRAVQTTRGIVVALGTALGAFVMFAPLHVLGIIYGDVGWVSAFTPVGGAVLMVLVAYSAASIFRASRTATVVVMGVWLFFTLMWDPNMPSLFAQRGVPLLTAFLMSAGVWHALGTAGYALKRAVGNR